jgi:hypothetical protein
MLRWRCKLLQGMQLLSVAVGQVKAICPMVGTGITARSMHSVALSSDTSVAEETRTQLLAQIPDGSDVAVSSDACVNQIVLSGVVSDVTSGFQQSVEVLQFVLDGEYYVRSPLRDPARVAWAQGLVGKEVVVTGRLKMDLHVDQTSKRVFQVPCVWIYSEVLDTAIHVLLQSSGP